MPVREGLDPHNLPDRVIAFVEIDEKRIERELWPRDSVTDHMTLEGYHFAMKLGGDREEKIRVQAE